MHNSEHPASVFSILDTGTKTIPLVTDCLFDLLMLKITSVYTSKKQTKVSIHFDIHKFLGDVDINVRNNGTHNPQTDRVERAALRIG